MENEAPFHIKANKMSKSEGDDFSVTFPTAQDAAQRVLLRFGRILYPRLIYSPLINEDYRTALARARGSSWERHFACVVRPRGASQMLRERACV